MGCNGIRLLFLAACLVSASQAYAASAGARDPWLWPFVAESPWNTPLGSGAQFAARDDPSTEDVVAGGAIIHSGQWSHPFYLARESDPIRTILDLENKRSFVTHLPAAAHPDPEADGHMYVVDPEHHYSYEMYHAVIQPDGNVHATRAFKVDLYGSGFHLVDGSMFPGVRAMDASGMGGILRVEEIKALNIPHALTFMLPFSRLKHIDGRSPGHGGIWPSARDDYWGFRDYKGHVPIGALIAIPPDVDIGKLGLSPGGLALAKALQDYGAYCADSVGTDKLVMSAEGAAEGQPGLNDMRADLDKIIHPLLRPVTNNTSISPGGGGTPRRPPAPPLKPISG